ncbi:competence protein ComK [Solibacillus sp. FSL H8-0538]|uniref:competence protein ComK n=1 Tax=Solibacillus sp. FSL H8-0538 TaxID=2921400 RepID=UPI0030F8EBC5
MNKDFRYVTSYIASNTTFLLRSITANGKTHTIIHDKQGKVKFAQKPIKIVRATCRIHGTTFEAAQKMAKLFFGDNRHKLPIMISIDYGNPCVFFPLFSPHSTSNIWVNLQSITNIVERGDETIITLTDMSEEVLPIHYKSFNQQYVRAMMFYKHLILNRGFHR